MLLKESWLEDDIPESNLIDYISEFKERLHDAVHCAHKNLKVSQDKMKTLYDFKSEARSFPIGSKVLTLLPIARKSVEGEISRSLQSCKEIEQS